jgi:large subunit ribosomal protein L6
VSRIGRKPVAVPKGVTLQVEGNTVAVKGPRGELRRALHPDMQIGFADNQFTVARPSDEKRHRALHGLTRTLVQNMVDGVSKGFSKSLEIQGVGYKAEQRGKNLVLSVGYANTVSKPIPANVTVQLEGANKIHITGADKQAVGQFAAEVRQVRKPEPYKGKGIRYEGEQVKIKPGKAFAGAGAK